MSADIGSTAAADRSLGTGRRQCQTGVGIGDKRFRRCDIFGDDDEDEEE